MQDNKTYRGNKLEFKYGIAAQCRRLRESYGLTLEEFCNQSGMNINLVRKMEMGQVCDTDSLFLLAKFYDKKIRLEFY